MIERHQGLSYHFLVNVKDQNGNSIYAGRKATAFSDAEEAAVKLTDAIPFPLETRLRELGAKYEKNDQLWGAHVAVDGQRKFFSLTSHLLNFLVSISSYNWTKSSICSWLWRGYPQCT